MVTLGSFDGVHLGHQELIRRAQDRAQALGGHSCAYTFHPAPQDVLRPDNGIPRIQRLEDRLSRLLELGVDHVVVEPFDLEFARREASWFVQVVLLHRLRAREIVVGWDFRFGRNREGDADLIARSSGLPVHQIEALCDGTEPISSSRIRRALAAGRVGAATALLGRPHEAVGEVVPGDGRGRTLGFPTANLRPLSSLLPMNGVYAVRARMEEPRGDWLPGVANLGTRPTFSGSERRVEVHLLDYRADLYGRRLRVAFVQRLRDERRFAGAEDLRAQIDRDIAAARGALEPGP